MKRFFVVVTLAGLFLGCRNEEVANRVGTAPSRGNQATEAGVILLRYKPGSESTQQREDGFLDELKQHPEINVLSSDQYAGVTVEEALAKSQQMLQKYEGRVQGIFAVCEPNANGTLLALEQARLTDKITFVGFDPNERMVQALAEKKMQGIVLQDPVTMGELSVKAMVAHLEATMLSAKDREQLMDGDQVKRRIPTGEFVATPENLDDEQMKRLLAPPQASGSEPPPTAPKYRIAVIPKGTTHEFWKSVHFGALRAAEELGNVQVLWKGPLSEADGEGQISVMQDFITKKVDGICLAPLDSRALVNVVKEAKAAGIPTVIFDSGLDDTDTPVSYVATDNENGGRLAARRMVEALKSKTVSAP